MFAGGELAKGQPLDRQPWKDWTELREYVIEQQDFSNLQPVAFVMNKVHFSFAPHCLQILLPRIVTVTFTVEHTYFPYYLETLLICWPLHEHYSFSYLLNVAHFIHFYIL